MSNLLDILQEAIDAERRRQFDALEADQSEFERQAELIKALKLELSALRCYSSYVADGMRRAFAEGYQRGAQYGNTARNAEERAWGQSESLRNRERYENEKSERGDPDSGDTIRSPKPSGSDS